MKDVRVSIIICTRNRADSLRETLNSIAQCEMLSDMPAELLVVDNGSTDHTRKIVEQAGLTNMPVRHVFEPRKGKGYAYNTGMAEARGDVFLFTDDDVRVPMNWIEGMCRPIAAGIADAIAGGVRLAPHLERPWLTGEIRGWVACTDGFIDPSNPARMVGANMAFSRRVLERVPEFDVELGPGALGFFDETLFTQQLLQTGYRVAGALDTVVEHHPDPTRFTVAGFRDIAVKLGRSSAYQFYHWHHGRIRFLYEKLVYYSLLLVCHRLFELFKVRDRVEPSPSQLMTIFQYNLHAQYLIERRGPHKYDQFGLAKIGGPEFSTSRFTSSPQAQPV